jgi:acyl-CoA thioester hydrolase
MSVAVPYSMTVTVGPEHIDLLDHVNNIAYLKWFQDIAIAHWRSVAPEEFRASAIWVVRRHEIDYLKPAFMNEELRVTTRVGDELTGVTWDRLTEIRRVSDDALLVQGRTVWVMIDAVTGRPKRIDKSLAAHFREPLPE